MKRDNALVQQVSHLADLEVEYDMTISVLAVLVERLQQLTGSGEVQISDEALINRPDLTAWRPAGARLTSLMASR
jgi:hypothetical protein